MESKDVYCIGKLAEAICDVYNVKVNDYEDKFPDEWVQVSLSIARKTFNEIVKAIEAYKKYEIKSAETDVIADIDAGLEDYPSPVDLS